MLYFTNTITFPAWRVGPNRSPSWPLLYMLVKLPLKLHTPLTGLKRELKKVYQQKEALRIQQQPCRVSEPYLSAMINLINLNLQTICCSMIFRTYFLKAGQFQDGCMHNMLTLHQRACQSSQATGTCRGCLPTIFRSFFGQIPCLTWWKYFLSVPGLPYVTLRLQGLSSNWRTLLNSVKTIV